MRAKGRIAASGLLLRLITLSSLIAASLVINPLTANATLTPTTTARGTYFGGNYYTDPNPTVMCSTGFALTATWSNSTLVGGGEDYSQAFAITCAKLNDDRTLSAITEFKSVIATQPNNVSSTCSAGKAATAIRVRWVTVTSNSNRWVIAPGTRCNNTFDYSGSESNAFAHNSSTSVGTVTESFSSCSAGSFVIGVEYESGAGLHGLAAICGSFPDVIAPSFTNGATFLLAENSATSSNAATIAVSESATITINAGPDSALFSLVTSDTTTAFIRFLASPNFESPADVGTNNVHDLSIRATDASGNFTNQAITVTVTNVNEAPVITTNSSNPTHAITQAENISAVATYAATDVDSGTSLTFSISGTDAGDFVMNSGSGVLAFASNPDFEGAQDFDTNNIYILVVAVSDGALSDTQTLTITITNANESGQVTAPAVSGTPTKGVSITVTVNVNTPGKVRFFVGGKRIATCLSRTTTGTNPNFSATCTWKPTVTGRQSLTATLTPTDNTFSTSTSARGDFFVMKRSTAR